MVEFTNETPVAILTVSQLREILSNISPKEKLLPRSDKKYVYGISGIAKLFNCSIPTANRIKKSRKIDKAICQIGRKIIVDVELALELVNTKDGGRRR